MTKKRNQVKEFLDHSPWALGAVVVAAVLSFLLSAGDQIWRLYERLKTPEPPASSIEILSQRGYEMVEATNALRNIPIIQAVLHSIDSIQKIQKEPELTLEKIPLWPVELLVLNPTKDRLNLHSCTLHVRYPGLMLPSVSFGYFVSDSFHLNAEDFGRIVQIEPQGAHKVRLIFVFADIQYKKHQELSLFNPAYIDLLCKDQERREIRTTYPVYSSIWSTMEKNRKQN